MANVSYIVGGKVHEDTETAVSVIVGGKVLEETTAAAGGGFQAVWAKGSNVIINQNSGKQVSQ